MTIRAETPDGPHSGNRAPSQTLKTLRNMLSRPTHHVDQLSAALRDRFQELDALRGRIAGDADDIRTVLAELTPLEAALLAAAFTFAFQSVCRSVVGLRASQLEFAKETDE